MAKLKALQCNYSVQFSQCCCRSPTSVTKAYFHRGSARVLQEGSVTATFHSVQIIKEKGKRAISHALHFKCFHPYKQILLAIPPFSFSYLIFMAVAKENVILRLLRHYL